MSNSQYPYVICHMLQSIDGKIAGSFFTNPATLSLASLYGQMSQEYQADAIIYGKTTADEIFTHGQHLDMKLDHDQKNEKKDFIAFNDNKQWIVVIDPQGSLAWGEESLKNERLTNKNVIEVLSEDVDDMYLEHLRKLNISYIFAGKKQLDMRVVLKKLKEKFHMSKVLLQGGGIVNQSFASLDLIDELSLIVSPVIGGETNVPTSFETDAFSITNDCHHAFHLVKAEILQHSGLWLNYQRKGE